MRKSLVFLSCAVAISFGLFGCGKKAQEKVAEGVMGHVLEKAIGKNASVDISDGNVKIKTGEGSIDASDGNIKIQSDKGNISILSGEEATKLPFPDDVYKYPDAVVMVAMDSPNGKHYGLETTDDAQKVYDAYKVEMEKRGWTTNMSAQENGEGMMMLAKETLVLQVVIGKDGKKVAINIMISENK